MTYSNINKKYIDEVVIETIKKTMYGDTISGTMDRCKYIVKNYGDYIEKTMNKKILIVSKDIKGSKGKSYWIITTKYLDMIFNEGININMYEFLDSVNPCKLYFDIEYKEELGKDAIYEFIKEVSIIFKKSFGEDLTEPLITTNLNKNGEQILKDNGDYSYHLVFYTKKRFKNSSKYLRYWINNILLKEIDDKYVGGFTDNSVYTKSSNLRMVGQSKIGKENQVSSIINENVFEWIGENSALNTAVYRNVSEYYLIQDLQRELYEDGDYYYDVGYEEEDEEDKLLNGDTDILDSLLTLPDKKSDIPVIIKEIEDIVLNIPNENQPDSIKILIATFCKKRGLKDLYVKWNGDDTFWNDLCMEGSIFSKKRIEDILIQYRNKYPVHSGVIDKDHYKSQSYDLTNCYCCWKKDNHTSQKHSLSWTNNCIKEICFNFTSKDGYKPKILYKNIANSNVSEDYLKYIVSLYHSKIIDLTLMKDFYRLLNGENDLNKKDIEYIKMDNKYLGDISKYIKPYWKNEEEKGMGIGFWLKKTKKVQNKRKNITNNTLIIQSDLGTGKSYSLEELVKKYPLHYQRKLIITSRVSYSTSILNRYNQGGLDFKYYKDDIDLTNTDNLVIQLESLYKILSKGAVIPFDLIILDECESVFNQFSSSTFLKSITKLKNIDTFKTLTNNSKQIIFMDAFITKRTIDTIRIFRPNDNVVLVNNKYRNGGLVFNELNNKYNNIEETIAEDIFNRLEKGEKIYGFISSKKSIKEIERILTFKSNGKYSIKTYHGDTDKKDKIIKDANIEWIKYDVVLTTSTITIGIDFKPSTPYFDCSFFLGNDMCCSIRDCLQGLYRVRELKSNQVYYSLTEVQKSMSLNYKSNKVDYIDTFSKCIELMKKTKELEELNDIVSDNDKRKWVLDILSWNVLESNMNRSFYKECFLYFCMIQKYEVNELVEDKIKSDKVKSNKTMNSTIRLLTDEEAKEIAELGENRTLEQSNQLKKYHYNKKYGMSDSEFLWNRYSGGKTKNPFIMDIDLNNNHSISDIEKTTIGDITAIGHNKQIFKTIQIKKLLNIINTENKDIYTEQITFKESDIKEYLISEELNMKKLKKLFNNSLFSVGNGKRNKTDKSKSLFIFKNTIEKKCRDDIGDYVESKERREDNNYTDIHTIRGDVNSVDTLNQYVSDVVGLMKSYKRKVKVEPLKLTKCLIK